MMNRNDFHAIPNFTNHIEAKDHFKKSMENDLSILKLPI